MASLPQDCHLVPERRDLRGGGVSHIQSLNGHGPVPVTAVHCSEAAGSNTGTCASNKLATIIKINKLFYARGLARKCNVFHSETILKCSHQFMLSWLAQCTSM